MKKNKSSSRGRGIAKVTYCYVMANFPFVFISKFGISTAPLLRRAQVDKTTPGWVFLVASVKIPFGYAFEQGIHLLYSWANVRLWRNASGGSEWFLCLNPVVLSLVFAFEYYTGMTIIWPVKIAVFAFPIIWLDGIFWVFALLITRALLIILVIALSIYLISRI